jgi:hypothetical protein
VSEGVGLANDEQDDGGAAQAFADLRAEVTVMRRAMEGLPAVIKSLAPPDYSPSFGAVGKALANVEARLAGIEGHPALKMTPAQHGGAMREAGASIFGDAVSSLNLGAQQLWRVKEEVQSLAVTARSAEAQKQALLWAVGAGVAVGLVLFPMLGAFAPGGSFLAAWATGNADRWQAGVSLIQEGSPERATALAAASRLVNANIEALQACADAAKKAGKEQKCSVVVQAPGP